jgi:hypothetical protein
LTRDAVHIVSVSDERVHDVVPLTIVEGVEVGRSMFQRIRGLGEIKLRLDRTVRPLQAIATLTDVEDPERVAALVSEHVDRVRLDAESPDAVVGGPGHVDDTGAATASPLPLVQELRELAALHDAGALTDEEFRQLKAKLIER